MATNRVSYWMALHHMTAASPPTACDTAYGRGKTSRRSNLALGTHDGVAIVIAGDARFLCIRCLAAIPDSDDGEFQALSRTRPVRVATTSPTQPHARAFAFIWSNSAWVIVPASRSCLADAI